MSSMRVEPPLLIPGTAAGRFVAGLTLKSSYCVSYTVIQVCALNYQTAHLEIQCVGIFSEDGESALHGVWAICTTTIGVYLCNPLQPLP